MRTFYHYSNGKFKYDPTVCGMARPYDTTKPHGLWLCDPTQPDNNWLSWIKENEFRHYNRRVKVQVDMTNILHLKTSADCFAFDKEYGRIPEHLLSVYKDSQEELSKLKPGLSEHLKAMLDDQDSILRSIDWVTVKSKYSGILVSPYSHIMFLRMGMLWYNAWDCSSACIWDSKAVLKTSVKRGKFGPFRSHVEKRNKRMYAGWGYEKSRL